ncbi:cysteine -tRNA ligase, putative [Plasmodium vivax]|uniref:cysteine--tRNA ligase n=2 Tax=Plasmodium vivax TaxID=5855 RepID=A5K7H8_PLAVS|nr:cysteine -tRNA ligase, putative [Plasmodium vivax]EDL44737.1 cysteine -tRNA ligase, putative [Plasmodium vivax]KMZ87015.1 cysteine -tRNA ligase [Plasmodium vivax Brazil I]|eukprot:XP_001614464.1 cysteine -tRNA ligase [Plasmodium vivax Sal-1]
MKLFILICSALFAISHNKNFSASLKLPRSSRSSGRGTSPLSVISRSERLIFTKRKTPWSPRGMYFIRNSFHRKGYHFFHNGHVAKAKALQCSMETSSSLPKWDMPPKEGKKITGLLVNNSLTRSKVEFVPQEKNQIKWYACGPTVYDAAHLGHARTYVSFDIIRRILVNYFKYDVFMVINITDIDDKIIKRSEEEKVSFTELARKWECEFWEDMKKLNVLLPTAITRVSEYVDQIIHYIEKIIDNKYAYVSEEGSVYFDIDEFKKSPKHFYARMEPLSVKDETKILEGEGDLGVISKKKKNAYDFALWKSSKPNEPYWDSPWGKGRPGWHIECSTMASNILGSVLDIHSGGVDLRFPHHDNELAQSEAFFDASQWVNYFLHSGHLHIEGLKMSKSLKNFITIKHMLSEYTPNQIRILFLLNKWDSFMNYSPNGESMVQCVEIDKFVFNFFALLEMKIKNFHLTNSNLFWTQVDDNLNKLFRSTKSKVHQALLDNFNTPEVILALQKLITEINIYLQNEKIQIGLLLELKHYISFILDTFGLVYGQAQGEKNDKFDELLHTLGTYRSNIRTTLQSNAKLIRKITKETKDATKKGEQECESSAAAQQRDLLYAEFVNSVKANNETLLKECDLLRDERLLNLGILIDDRPNNEFVVKLLDENQLQQEKRKREQELSKRKGKSDQNDKRE